MDMIVCFYLCYFRDLIIAIIEFSFLSADIITDSLWICICFYYVRKFGTWIHPSRKVRFISLSLCTSGYDGYFLWDASTGTKCSYDGHALRYAFVTWPFLYFSLISFHVLWFRITWHSFYVLHLCDMELDDFF